jgi:hypothetical protein
MEKVTELIFILDESGSMHKFKEDTLGGFHSVLDQQKKKNPNGFVSLWLFGTSVKPVYEHFPVKEAPDLTHDQYVPKGLTALYDAIGMAITKAHTLSNTLFVITTDGKENASRRFSRKDVQKLISKSEKQGAQFLFLAGSLDAVQCAEQIGISPKSTTRFVTGKQGIKEMYTCMQEAVADFMETGTLPQSLPNPLMHANKSADTGTVRTQDFVKTEIR